MYKLHENAATTDRRIAEAIKLKVIWILINAKSFVANNTLASGWKR